MLNIVETVNPRSTIIRVVEESKPGKRAAMYTGLAYVDTEITVFADDDALYGPAVLKSLIMPFKDPAMGGCGTRQIARPKGDTFKFEDIMMVRKNAMYSTSTGVTLDFIFFVLRLFIRVGRVLSPLEVGCF